MRTDNNILKHEKLKIICQKLKPAIPWQKTQTSQKHYDKKQHQQYLANNKN